MRILLALGLWVLASFAASAAAPPPLKRYGDLPGIEAAAMSPSGDHLALVGVTGEARQLVVFDASMKPIFLSNVGDFKLIGLSFVGEDRLLVVYHATATLGPEFTASKTELHAAMVVPLDGSKPWAVFGGYESITGGIRGTYGVTERGGQWFGYFGGITLVSTRGSHYLGSTAADLYEVDMKTRKIDRIGKRLEGETDRDWLVDANGAIAAIIDFSPQDGSWAIKSKSLDRIASGKSPTGAVDLVGFGPRPGTLVYGDDDAEGRYSWFELPLTGGSPTPFLAGQSVRTTYMDRDRRIIGYMSDDNEGGVHFFDPNHNKAMQALRRAFKGRIVKLQSFNRAFDRLVVSTEGNGDPQSWWLVDRRKGNAAPLGMAYPMAESQVGPIRVVPYKAADGLAMEGILTLPPGREAKGLPLVMLPHGGPTARDYPEFDWWAQALASRGYAVFQPNFRGSSGYGQDFEQAGHGEWGRKMQSDITDGLAELVRQGLVDPRRVCIMGASYGGYAALAGVTLQQGLYRCAVAVAGVSDVAKMAMTELRESGRNPTVSRSLKKEIGMGRDLKAVSPVNFADKADAPILLVHGKDDTVVLLSQSTAMHAALTRANKPVEFVTLDGEDHWLSKGDTRLKMLTAAVAFVERHNPPDAVVKP